MEIASITTSLAPLAILACPVGMGLMMWMMAKGSKSASKSAEQTQAKPPEEPASITPDRPASVEVLREEHRRLGEEIERLENQRSETSEAAERR